MWKFRGCFLVGGGGVGWHLQSVICVLSPVPNHHLSPVRSKSLTSGCSKRTPPTIPGDGVVGENRHKTSRPKNPKNGSARKWHYEQDALVLYVTRVACHRCWVGTMFVWEDENWMISLSASNWKARNGCIRIQSFYCDIPCKSNAWCISRNCALYPSSTYMQ